MGPFFLVAFGLPEAGLSGSLQDPGAFSGSPISITAAFSQLLPGSILWDPENSARNGAAMS